MAPKAEGDRETVTAAPLVPRERNLHALKQAASHCRACPLWERGTQTVFGDGQLTARLMLVGEQPGDAEDRQGLPFVGPAGRLLDQGLEGAGIERKDAYVTNVVKHFKWVPKGRLRLHQKPNAREIGACMPWLEAEIELIKPDVIVAMGVTATQALVGRSLRVTREHGLLLPGNLAPHALVTVHPSSILRIPSEEERHRAMKSFIEDLRVVAKTLAGK